MEFEDYLIVSGVRMEPDEDDNGRKIPVDYKGIINKFKASLKNSARVWYSIILKVELQIYTQRQDGKQSTVGFVLTSIQ